MGNGYPNPWVQLPMGFPTVLPTGTHGFCRPTLGFSTERLGQVVEVLRHGWRIPYMTLADVEYASHRS